MNTTAEDLIQRAAAALARPAPRTSTPEDPVHFVPTGEVVIKLPGKTGAVTLPRPTFGQIKKLIRSEGATTDRINGLIASAQATANQLITADGAGDLKARVEDLDALTAIRDKARATADECTDAVAEALGDWWRGAFEILEIPVPNEDNWPSEFMDASLPGRLISHWRYAPAGPG